MQEFVVLCKHSPLSGCTPSLLGWHAPLAISLLLIPVVACQMSPVSTLEANYCDERGIFGLVLFIHSQQIKAYLPLGHRQ